jgi:hypothetical protein
MIPKRAKRRAARLSNQIRIVLGFEPVCGQFPAWQVSLFSRNSAYGLILDAPMNEVTPLKTSWAAMRGPRVV